MDLFLFDLLTCRETLDQHNSPVPEFLISKIMIIELQKILERGSDRDQNENKVILLP